MNLKLANESWEALLKAHSRIMRDFQKDKNWQELSMSEYDVLYTLKKANKPIRLHTLEYNVLLSQPALSRLVERLQKRGLIDKTVDPEDRRAQLLTITQKGVETQKRVGRAHAKSVHRAMQNLSSGEKEQLKNLTEKLIAQNL